MVIVKQNNNKIMISSYIKIAFRNLRRNLGFTLINVLGLAIGVMSAVLIFTVVSFELSYDNFHSETDRIYRLVRKTTTKTGEVDYTAGSPLAFQEAVRNEIPQFEKKAAVYGTVEPQITILGKDPNNQTNAAKYIEENQGICVEPSFFEVFHFKWLVGSPAVLKEPNVVVLSKKYAEKYFGSVQNTVGQYIKVNNLDIIKVVGILEDIPENTDLPLDIAFSYESKRKNPKNWGFAAFDDWGSTSSQDVMFVKLPQNFEVKTANSLLEKITKAHYDSRKDPDSKIHYLVPFSEMHYDANFGNLKDKVISKSKIWGLILVGALIVLMACINFINIATALASRRAKEVGVRKTLGSFKSHLINQFMVEVSLLVLFAILLGLILAWGVSPILTSLFDFPENTAMLSSPTVWLFLVALFILISSLSGIYPALILSSFSPLEAFRQKTKASWAKGISFRQILIVFQFTVAMMLLVAMIVNYQQMDYLDNADLGFRKQGILSFACDTEFSSRNDAFKAKLREIKEVESVSFSSDLPSSDNNWQSNFNYNNSAQDEGFNVNLKFADDEYFKTFNIKFVAGSAYSDLDTNKKAIVNETLLKKIGVKNPELAIGKMIRLGGNNNMPICGVFRDFRQNSAKEEVAPLMMTRSDKYYWRGNIKLNSTKIDETKKKIEAAFNEVYPEVVFSSDFFEDRLKEYYKSENQMGKMFRISSIIAILIAALGLFGLATFVTEQRTKEIGIRKVMGASLISITTLISKDFLKLVGVSMIIAFPLAYYLMNQWLQDFVLRINIQWWYFALAGVFCVVITLFSISYQTLKSALVNPVKSLKSE